MGGAKPFETRSLIQLLASTDLVLDLPWNQATIESNVGVKQGATESPLLFARLLDDLMSEVQLANDEKVLHDLPHDSAVFMDDVLTWKRSVEGLQRYVNKLLPLLADFGLFVQPDKCKLLCVRGSRAKPLVIQGRELYPLPQGKMLMIMNLPLGIEATEQRILEAMVERVRGKFYEIARVLCSNAPLSLRCKVLEAVVFGSIRWCLGALVPTAQAQQLLNNFQYNCLRRVMGVKRGQGEGWLDFEMRSLRLARAKVFQVMKVRWGDKHLVAFLAIHRPFGQGKSARLRFGGGGNLGISRPSVVEPTTRSPNRQEASPTLSVLNEHRAAYRKGDRELGLEGGCMQ